MGLLMVLAATLWGFVACHNEESIRIAGYVLQLLGMIVAVSGLLRVREHFDQPLLRHLALQWLKRFPRWKRSGYAIGGLPNIELSDVTGRAEAWNPDDPEKPIEQRIEAIIKNLYRVREEQREYAHSIDKLKESHEEHKNQVAEEQNNMKETIHSDLESLHASDVITSLVGLVWLTVGITMSTLAPELSQWLY